jgi:hypothetical protein
MVWFGFALQYAGLLILLFGWHRQAGAALPIVFTVAETAIFHCWWLVTDDPLRRCIHLENCALRFSMGERKYSKKLLRLSDPSTKRE